MTFRDDSADGDAFNAHIWHIDVDVQYVQQVGMAFQDNGTTPVVGIVDYVEYSPYA